MKTSKPWLWTAVGLLLAGLGAASVMAQDADEPKQSAPAAPPASKSQETENPGSPNAAAEQPATGDKAAPAANEKAAKKEEKPVTKLEIFELKHAKPQEMIQLLRMDRVLASGVAHFPGYPLQFGYRGAGGQGAQNTIRVAADEERGVLFVRGPEDQVQAVSRLVKAFDAPADQMTKGEQVEGKYIAPLLHADAQQVTAILQQLQLSCQTLQIGDVTLLVIGAEGDDLEQAKQVIAKLDSRPDKAIGEATEDVNEATEGAAKPQPENRDQRAPAKTENTEPNASDNASSDAENSSPQDE